MVADVLSKSYYRRGTRTFGVLALVLTAVLAQASMYGAPTGSGLLGTTMLALAVALIWRVTVRPALKICGRVLDIEQPVSRCVISIDDIRGVQYSNGVVVRTRAGDIPVFAFSPSLIAKALGDRSARAAVRDLDQRLGASPPAIGRPHEAVQIARGGVMFETVVIIGASIAVHLILSWLRPF